MSGPDRGVSLRSRQEPVTRVLKQDITTISARSFDRFGDWYYVLDLPRIILNGGVRAFRSPEFCRGFRYDANR